MFRRKKHRDPIPPGAPFPQDSRDSHYRRRALRHGLWLYLFAFVGVAAICFLLIRWLLIPLLVALA